MKAQDFLLGARDFFAVLVPGAVVIFILIGIVIFSDGAVERSIGFTPREINKISSALENMPDLVQVFGFTVMSYALGQVISAASSILDIPIDRLERNYGRLFRRYSIFRQLRSGVRLWRFRCLADSLKNQITSDLIGQQKPGALTSALDENSKPKQHLWSVKSFWRDYLRIYEADAIAELDRIESAQKMFRSLGVVALLAFILLIRDITLLGALAGILVFVLCYLLFARFRIEFFYRLYKLAVLTSLPEGLVPQSSDRFFRKLDNLLTVIDADVPPVSDVEDPRPE